VCPLEFSGQLGVGLEFRSPDLTSTLLEMRLENSILGIDYTRSGTTLSQSLVLRVARMF
jgi:hypothetical protein